MSQLNENEIDSSIAQVQEYMKQLMEAADATTNEAEKAEYEKLYFTLESQLNELLAVQGQVKHYKTLLQQKQSDPVQSAPPLPTKSRKNVSQEQVFLIYLNS